MDKLTKEILAKDESLRRIHQKIEDWSYLKSSENWRGKIKLKDVGEEQQSFSIY